MRYVLLFVFLSALLHGQTPDKIKIKKEDGLYFFQIGEKSDTISMNKNDLFYLKFTGTTGCTTRIEIENGRLFKTKNDTVFQLKNVPHLQYEHYYQDTTWVANKGAKTTNNNCHKFITHINGANEKDGKIIRIQMYNVGTKENVLINTFHYK